MSSWNDEPPRTDPGDMTRLTVPEAKELEALLLAQRGRWLSFQTVDQLGINLNYSNWITPQAIYGFEVDVLLKMLPAVEKYAKQKDASPYIHRLGYLRRSDLFFFDVDGPVVQTETYTAVLDDLAKLRDLTMECGWEEMSHRFAHWLRSRSLNAERKTGYHGDTWALITAMDCAIDQHLNLFDQEGPYRHHPDKPSLWRELFVALGYSGFCDHHGVLTGDLMFQTAVFNETALRDVEHLENPLHIEPPTFRR
jgi:hypothetical protein